jgi:hypothetical protein
MNTKQILRAIFEEFPLSRGLPSHFQQLATRHPEIGQREQRCKLCGVFLQTTVAHLNRVRGADLTLGPIPSLATPFVKTAQQGTAAGVLGLAIEARTAGSVTGFAILKDQV